MNVSLSINHAILPMLDNSALSVKLSRTAFIEAMAITYAYHKDACLNDEQLNELILNFPVNKDSTIYMPFKKEIGFLCREAQFAAVYLLSGLSLIPEFMITTKRQSNLHKNGNAVCYFALGRIGANDEEITEYINRLNLKTNIIGTNFHPNNEYFYISNRQQFRIINPPKPYVLYPNLCGLLNVPVDTDIIKIHYSEVDTFLNAFIKL